MVLRAMSGLPSTISPVVLDRWTPGSRESIDVVPSKARDCFAARLIENLCVCRRIIFNDGQLYLGPYTDLVVLDSHTRNFIKSLALAGDCAPTAPLVSVTISLPTPFSDRRSASKQPTWRKIFSTKLRTIVRVSQDADKV